MKNTGGNDIFDQDFLKKIRSILNYFNSGDQEILCMRFGIDGGGGHSIKELTAIFGVTDVYIRTIEAKALQLVRSL